MSFTIERGPVVTLVPARRGLRARVRSDAFAYWSSPHARHWHVRGGAGPVPSLADLRPLLHPGAKRAELHRAAQAEADLQNAHLAEVAVIGPAVIAAEETDEGAVAAELRSQALLEPGRSRLAGRWRAGRTASRTADGRITDRRHADADHRQTELTEASDRYTSLVDNDPGAVLSAVEALFEHDDVPAAPVGCAGGTLSLVVRLPPPTDIPDMRVSEAGRRPALVARSEAERNALHVTLLASTALTAIRRAIAAAPGLTQIRVLVVRQADAARRTEAVFAGVFSAQEASGWASNDTDPLGLLLAGDERVLGSRTPAGVLDALTLDGEPDIAAVVSEVDGALFP